jgi:GNAT superfamily N-acetyltransferase
MLERRIEEVSLNAWPATEQMLYDGWVLRFAGGYTKRANSVTPLYPGTLDIGAKVAACEAIYAARGLPPIFRLPTMTAPQVDETLARRGYRLLDPTLVLARPLASDQADAADGAPPSGAALREAPPDDWLALYSRLSDAPLTRQALHGEILARIGTPRLMAAWHIDGRPVACALGVLEGDCFGLFDLVTAPDERRKGYAMALVRAMLDWACHRGARYAYLQVVRDNAPARALYERLGYRELYAYHYRVPGA